MRKVTTNFMTNHAAGFVAENNNFKNNVFCINNGKLNAIVINI